MATKRYITAKERHQFIDSMFSRLENVPIEEIVGSRIDLIPRQSHLVGLCPFHNDTHYGSFIVTPSKGIWKCFACGKDYGGNGIKFISMHDNSDYLHAAFQIALEKGLISTNEYELYSEKQTYSKTYIHELKTRHSKKDQSAVDSSKNKKASEDICHNVYTALKESCRLSEVHLEHLKNIRHLSLKRVEADYFTFPTTAAEKKKVMQHIKERYPAYTDEILITVPGFYFDRESKKVTFYAAKGIGILLHNAEGNIIAIQLRRDAVKEGQQRYIWFSSAFTAYDQEKYLGGSSCGAPRDILYPDSKTQHSIVCITEGRFKSEVLCAAGNIAISLQGVGSWKDIDKDFTKLLERHPIKNAYLMFDADMFGNTAVFDQSVSLLKNMVKAFPSIRFRYAVWHIADGKGIDDLFHNGKIETIQYKEISELQITYQNVLKTMFLSYGVESIREIPREQIPAFKKQLQEAAETAILP